MSGSLAQRARRTVEAEAPARSRPERTVPVAEVKAFRSHNSFDAEIVLDAADRPLPPTTRERLEAAYAPEPEPEPDNTEPTTQPESATPEPAEAPLTTRARIVRQALAAEAPEPEPEPEPEAEEAVAFSVAVHPERKRVGLRVVAAPAEAEADNRAAPPPAGEAPAWWPALRLVPKDEAAETGKPVRAVEPVARGPPADLPVVHPIVQTKLSISAPGDPLEVEADSVALGVLRGGLADAPTGRRVRVFRASPAAVDRALPPRVAAVVTAPGGGAPLERAMRERIEPHLGVDLAEVRVRRGPDAAAAARDLRARAFTSGSTIYLAAESSPGDVVLMAHEAAHVVQQRRVPAARTTLHRDITDYLPDISVSDVIPDWILDGVRSAVRAIPGYTMLTYIVGRDPLTDEPVTADSRELIDTLLTYGPFGPAVGLVLQTIEVLGEIFTFVRDQLVAHDLTLGRIGRDIADAWDELSITNGIAGNVAIVKRYVNAFLRDVRTFVDSIVDRVLEIVRSVVADVAEPLLETPQIAPVWNLTKKVLHFDPLHGTEVQAPTAELIADFLRLIGQEQRLAQMEDRGTLQKTADWLDTQLATFASLITELGTLFSDAWAAIQPQNLPDLMTNLESLAQRVFAFVQRVAHFAGTLILKILELIKDALLGWLSENAHRIPGFHLLTVIIGKNPFTGEEVARTAENLIKGFITLLPNGEATYDQLAESGVIGDAAARIEGEMARLGISLELVTGLFHSIWDTLTLDDLLDPIGAFERIFALLAEPLSRLIEFIGVVIEVVITLVLRLMNFPTDLLGSIIANALQAIEDIKRDPVGFIKNMLAAVKLGFSNFLDNILVYLVQGLQAWLFRGLGQLGITIPSDLSLMSILTLVLQVLGITAEHLWQRLGQHIGPDRVQMIRDAIDRLTGIWDFIKDVQERGISAIWRFVSDQLSNLWDTLLDMAKDWIMTTIVQRVTAKLLSMLDPTGIMAVVNSFIAFFNAVQSAIEYLREILEIINRWVTTLAAVAAGNILPGAQLLEQGLAAAIPVAIGFLANQVGLGNVPEKVVEIIGRLRELVDRAIDWLIDQALRLGTAVLNALTSRPEAPPEEAPPPLVPEGPATPLTQDEREQLYNDVAQAVGHGAHTVTTPEEGQSFLTSALARFGPRGLRSLSLAAAEGHVGIFDIEAEASPGRKVGSVKNDERITLADLTSRYITVLIAALNGEQLGPPQRSRGKSEGDHQGHAENWLLTYLSSGVMSMAPRGERNELDVRITRSPCPECQGRIMRRLDDLRDLGFDIHMTIRTASIHRGHTTAGIEAFVDIATLDREHITLEAWDIIHDLESLGIPQEEREALENDPDAVRRLETRVARVRNLLQAIAQLRVIRGGA